jgi:hypothetical protein
MINQISKSLLILPAGGLCLPVPRLPKPQPHPPRARGAGVVDRSHPRVNQVNGLETNQQNRIANGVKNGSLSSKQTSNLEEREANVQNPRKRTWRRTTGISPRRNRTGLIGSRIESAKSIYKDKHK